MLSITITPSVNSSLSRRAIPVCIGWDPLEWRIERFVSHEYGVISDITFRASTVNYPRMWDFDDWNEATPLGYDTASTTTTQPTTNRKLENRTLHLAREHRFVIKDKLLNYDMFVVFEDDMLITADHVNHYIAVTNELRRLEDLAPVDFTPMSAINTKEKALQQYHGTMTKGQLRRMIPGFMRVEVLLDERNYPAQSNTGPVPVDLSFTTNGAANPQRKSVNATTCCHISDDHWSNENRPGRPNADQLMIWETNIMPLGIRKMPSSCNEVPIRRT